MSDLVERTSSSLSASASASCLAIATASDNQKTQRPGGCVGIFFQLFDWNRRLAKKKLFPKKLLSLARTKQVSKKFIADEKLPKSKHLLIAEENSGGFPIMKKNFSHKGVMELKKHEMQSPGLVARLMGLETLPAVQKRRKSDKGSADENCYARGGSFVGGLDLDLDMDMEVLSPEKGSQRSHELRPEKIQKTGLSQRHPVARFGADALQISSVLSRSRKHHLHHHKLASPVKSPRVGRGTSRLIDAATKILDPGLQARSRAKCAIRYSDPVIPALKGKVPQGVDTMVMEMTTESTCGRSAPPSSLRGQNSCKNCGNLLDDTKEQAQVFELSPVGVKDIFLQGLADCNPRSAACTEKEREVVLLRSKHHSHGYCPSQEKANLPAPNETVVQGMGLSGEGPDHRWHFPTRACLQNDASLSVRQRTRVEMQKQVQIGQHRLPPRTRLANAESRRTPSIVKATDHRRDFIAINGSIGPSQREVPGRLGNVCKARRRYYGRGDDSLSTPKCSSIKRTANDGRQARSSLASSSSTMETQRTMKNRTVIAGKPTLSDPSINHPCVKSGPASHSSSKDMDVVFSFSSPLRSMVANFCPLEMNEGQRDECDSGVGVAAQAKLSTAANCREESPQSFSSLLMNQDALGALLEQKLKELTWQAEEESETGLVPSRRATASILEELIAALSAARLISQDDQVKELDKRNTSCTEDSISDTTYQAKASKKTPDVAVSHEGDHLSPGSVLETSLSNGSCISSSIDYSSENVLQSDGKDFSGDKPQSAYTTDPDVLDSASSVAKASVHGITFSSYLLNHISVVLHNADLAPMTLCRTKVDYKKEVIWNTAVLFGEADRFVDFLLGPFLDKLQTSASAAWTDSILVIKGVKLVKGFLLDCLLECLDLRYRRYCNSGFKLSCRCRLLPVPMNTELLIQALDEDFETWTGLVGKPVDEIIEWEMSTGLGKWTDFEMEGFEMGSEIGLAIMQMLVDELVIDIFWD
ncbi:hypothetical protein Dimus_023177 [Dionaea muscipula]